MSVQDVADHVVEVLRRAESLFSPPSDTRTTQLTAAVADASDASRAIGARTAELGGAVADAHGDMMAAVGRRLDDVGVADAQLTEHLARTAELHMRGASYATDVRRGAEELPSRLGPTTELPASELAALLALRNHVADMQRLLAEHTGQAARDADVILDLGYQP
jgi:hypothetical protein